MAILTTKPLGSTPLGSTPLGSRDLGSSDGDDSSLFYGMSAGLLSASRGAGAIYVFDGEQFALISDPAIVPTINSKLSTPSKRVADLTVRPMYREWTAGAIPTTGDIYAHNAQDGSTRLMYCETGGNAMPSMWGLQRADRGGATALDSAGNSWIVGAAYASKYGAYFEPESTQIVANPANPAEWVASGPSMETLPSIIEGYEAGKQTYNSLPGYLGVLTAGTATGVHHSVFKLTGPITGAGRVRLGTTADHIDVEFHAANGVITGVVPVAAGAAIYTWHNVEFLPGGWIQLHVAYTGPTHAYFQFTNAGVSTYPESLTLAYSGFVEAGSFPMQPIPEAATRPGDGAANAPPTRQETLDATSVAGKTLVFAHASTAGGRGYLSISAFMESLHYSGGADTDPRILCDYSGGAVFFDPIASGTASSITPSYSSSVRWKTAGTSITAEGFEITDQPTTVSNAAVDFTFFNIDDGALPLRIGVFNSATNIREMTLRACGIWTDADAFDFDAEFGPGLYSGQPLPIQTAPVVSSVSDSATSDSITVACSTDENCDVVLAVTGAGTNESLNGTTHVLTVAGLAAETTYQWTSTATSKHSGLVTVDSGSTTTLSAGVAPVTVTMLSAGAETWTKTGDGIGTLSTEATVSDAGALLNWRIDGGAWTPTPLGASGNQAIDFPGLVADGVADYLVDATVDDTGSYSGGDSGTYTSDDLSDAPIGGLDPADTLFANHVESGTRNYTVTPPVGSSPGDYCFVIVQTAHGSEPNSYPAGLTKINWVNSGANGIAALEGPVKAGNAGWDFGHQYSIAWQSCAISNVGASDVQSAGAWTAGDSSDPITIPDSVVAAGGAGIPIAVWTSDRNTMQGTDANKGVWSTDNGDTVNVRWHNSGSGDDNVPAVGTTGTPSLNVSYRAVILADGAQLGSISMASSLAGRTAGSFTFTLVE